MSNKELVVWDRAHEKMMSTLRNYVTRVQAGVNKNNMGMPDALVNPQVIQQTGMITPLDQFMDELPHDIYLPIVLTEGIPTILGVPIWEKLESEPIEYYELFKRYRSMVDMKIPRAVYRLAVETQVEVRTLEMLRLVYHWGIRVSAFDNYLAQERNFQLEQRRREIEGKHSKTAEKLFEISSKYLMEHSDLITPKVALQMFEMAVKLERVSVGMASESARAVSVGSNSITIQNNIGESIQTINGADGITTGNLDEDKQRLTSVLNIMNNIGLLKEEQEAGMSDIIDVESKNLN